MFQVSYTVPTADLYKKVTMVYSHLVVSPGHGPGTGRHHPSTAATGRMTALPIDEAALRRMMASAGGALGLDTTTGSAIPPQPTSFSTPSDLVALVLRPHGGGMPEGAAANYLAKVGPDALSILAQRCGADSWDAVSGYGALSRLAAYGHGEQVADALDKRPDSVSMLLKWLAYMPALDQRACDTHQRWVSNLHDTLAIDGDRLCDKESVVGEVDHLLSAADASAPISPAQQSSAHALVVSDLLSVLRCALGTSVLRTRITRSKHAMRAIDKLTQLLGSSERLQLDTGARARDACTAPALGPLRERPHMRVSSRVPARACASPQVR